MWLRAHRRRGPGSARHLASGRAKPGQATRPLRSDRLVINTKVCKRVHDGHHLPAEFGEAILNAGRILAIVVAKDQAIVFHLSQAVGKHLLRDSLKVAAQLIETPRAYAQVTDNEQLPLAANERYRRCDRTLRKLLFAIIGGPTFLSISVSQKGTQLQICAYSYLHALSR